MKIKVAISSWGNIGRALATVHAGEAKAPDHDMELVGIIRRNPQDGNSQGYPQGVPVAGDVNQLSVRPDVVICAAPSYCVMEDVQKYLRSGFSTVDCFDNHGELPEWRERLDCLALEHKAVSVTGAGWDPGFDSVVRGLSGLVVAENAPVTTFGPGRSMGHTTTVKAIHPDIKDAVALTLPGSEPGLQRREVYIGLNPRLRDKATQDKIQEAILRHPAFKDDDSHVFFVESIAAHDTGTHGGVITREGSAARVELKLHGDNALMTALAMYGAARAAGRGLRAGNYGCRTLAELAPLDFVKGETTRERLARIKY